MINVQQKRKLTLLLVSLMTLLVVSAALAYLVDRKTVTNILGIGNKNTGGSTDTVWIDVKETAFLNQKIPGTKIKTINVNNNHVRYELTGLTPGSKINKDTTVEVKGIESYIRIKPIMDITDATGKIVTPASASQVLTKEQILAQLAIYNASLYDESKWIFHKDGYMYYKDVVSKNEDLSALKIPVFQTTDNRTMSIPKDWTSDVEPLTIEFIAEAIQAEGVILETKTETYPTSSLWRDADTKEEATDVIFA